MPRCKLLWIILLLLPFGAICQSTVWLEQKELKISLTRDAVVDAWNQSFPGYALLTTKEKDILYWTNYSRSNPKRFWDSVMIPILSAYPQLRGKYASSLEQDLLSANTLPFFGLNDTLVKTARQHATDISSNSTSISHNSTDGTSFAQRLKRAGIMNCGSENMSLGGGDVLLSIALLYLDYGLEVPGHRRTLLNPVYATIGIGAATYGKSQFFFVQDFACQQN